MSRRILDDCESTYKIYNRILKEGKNNSEMFGEASYKWTISRNKFCFVYDDLNENANRDVPPN